ncbi:MAG: hypothetical protein NUV46_02630 [Nanoarchaeota archaeon]|nr:hypothetical protein [Nanoarchaeota archaeon]
MKSFCFSVSGKPHEIQKVYNKLKNFLLDVNYFSDSYSKNTLLPRGSSEIEVIKKKGYIFSFFNKNVSFHSNFTTSFLRESGRTFGYNSRLSVRINSDDPSKLIKAISQVSEVDPVFLKKESYGFSDEKDFGFIDLL